jgi:hypothetical protein
LFFSRHYFFGGRGKGSLKTKRGENEILDCIHHHCFSHCSRSSPHQEEVGVQIAKIPKSGIFTL